MPLLPQTSTKNRRQAENRYLCMVPLKCLYKLADPLPRSCATARYRAIFTQQRGIPATRSFTAIAIRGHIQQAHGVASPYCSPPFYAENPANHKTAGVSARCAKARARATVNASAILDFKIHKSLVQKLVGYFAKCHGADKRACSLVFKI